MKTWLLRNATLVNEGTIAQADIRLKNGRIEKIAGSITASPADEVLDISGLYVLPGVIDDQVHFREPGFPHKGSIGSESRAAVAGGVTSFMEMPNTNPTTTTHQALEDKRNRAAASSWANYAFFFGASNQNLEAVLSVDPQKTCGIKVFMGSSTGDMLVDQIDVLENIFRETNLVVATHCEDEATVRYNLQLAKEKYGTDIPMGEHATIRSREACFLSSSLAVELAKKYDANLHVLHLTTAEEIRLFSGGTLVDKKITAEVCVHHLHYQSGDYTTLGGQIKCNPAIKRQSDQEALWAALQSDHIDVIATDHAPHTWEEKQQPYATCPSGLPLVQHGLQLMLDATEQGKIQLARVVEKMCHNPATRFSIQERGFLREGYWADIVVVGLGEKQLIEKAGIHYHCGWSPLEGEILRAKIHRTFVNGTQVYDGRFHDIKAAMAIHFQRS